MLTAGVGCYECSQRRIDCDNTHPFCKKCDSKGISCSGFGVKYRFRDGLTHGRKGSKGRFDSWVHSGLEATTTESSVKVEDSAGSSRGQSCPSEGVFDSNLDMSLPTDWSELSFTSPDSDGTDEWKSTEHDSLQSMFSYQIDGEVTQIEPSGFSPSIWDTGFDVLEGGAWEDASNPSLLSNSNAVFEVVAEYTSILGDQKFSTHTAEDGLSNGEDADEVICQSPGIDMACMGSPPTLTQEIDLFEPSKLFLLRHCKSLLPIPCVSSTDCHQSLRKLPLKWS